jgi:hypothetical protein
LLIRKSFCTTWGYQSAIQLKQILTIREKERTTVADRARNVSGWGKSVSLNVLTPISPGATWFLRLWLWILDRGFSLLLWGCDHFNIPDPPARSLSILSFVQWVIVTGDRLPQAVERRPKTAIKYNYLLFMTSFTGPWVPYIDAFSDILGSTLDSVWFWTVRYPGAKPVAGLLAHILKNRIESDHNYSAYPAASIRDVQSAAVVEAALKDLEKLSNELTAEQFAGEYQRVVLRLQNYLGAIGTLPDA